MPEKNPPALETSSELHSPLTNSKRLLKKNTEPGSDPSIHRLYAMARELVEDQFDLDLGHVPLKLSQNSALEEIVRRETERLTHAVFSNQRFANFFLERVMQDQEGSYAGLFVAPENVILINRDLLEVFLGNMKNQPARLVEESILALLIHELVHAADNERFQIHAKRELNFRASVAQSAVFEGHAQLHTRDICKRAGCLHGLQRLDAFMFEAPEPADPLARSLQAVSRNVLEYSYVEGERFLRALQQRKNGDTRLVSALQRPPQDPVQILAPENYPDTARIARNQEIVELIRAADHRWNDPQFAMIEISPIKGLDLRNNPQRRAATKEGFTRLIRSMIGLQIFDQSTESMLPVDITVMQADSTDTARLFARSFYNKSSQGQDGTVHSNTLDLTLKPANNANRQWPMRVFVTQTIADQSETQQPRKKSLQSADEDYVHVVATSGRWIIQIGGFNQATDATIMDFAELAMLNLLESNLTRSDKL